MPEPCVICTYEKREAIDAELDAGLQPSVIAARYHLRKALIALHATHRGVSMSLPSVTASNHAYMASREHVDVPAIDALQRVTYHLQQAAVAWREVDSSRKSVDRLQMILQEAFADVEMGL